MIYRPSKGSMWDPSVIWHDSRYHAFMMYNQDGPSGLEAQHCLRAASDDGVHWKDDGVVIEERERERGSKFFKCFVGRCGERFIMDHGVARDEGQDTLRFYESTDLDQWEYLFSSNPDPRWYEDGRAGRWDHMYMLAKEEVNPTAGYWGYPVATPRQDLPRGCGLAESADGRSWSVLPPPEFDWGDVPPKDLEIGGVERMDGKYIMIGGLADYISPGYSMYTLIADDPRGPFRPTPETYRLCGTSTHAAGWGVSFLATWCRGRKGERLISNYASVPSGTWLLPLRKAVFDGTHLRLAWWEGNGSLRTEPTALESRDVIVNDDATGRRATWLDRAFDLERGIVLEGTIMASSLVAPSSAGFMLEEDGGNTMELRLGIGAPEERETHIGRYSSSTGFTSEDVTGRGCATVTGIGNGTRHAFRLLARHDLYELYVDDLLVQTYVYRPTTGRVGFVACGAEATFSDLAAYDMAL